VGDDLLWVRRASPRRTARPLIPQASSPVLRRRSAPPWTEHSRSRSMAKRSNRAVNGLPGSAQGTGICPAAGGMDRALDAGDHRLDPGREQAGVQVAPAARLPVIPRDLGLALGARERARPCVHVHDHVLPLDVQLYAHHAPGFPEAQDGPEQITIAHDSVPPFEDPSVAQVETVTHTIS
jgi:hypothetical protein